MRSARRPTAGSTSRSSRTASSAASTDMLSQVRSGALDIFTVGSPLANVVPVSAIPQHRASRSRISTGVWAAVDGDLGAHIRQQIGSIGLDGVRQDVGQRLSPDHHQQQADQRAERPQGPEAARAGEPAVHLDVPRARHRADRASTSSRSTRRCRPRLVDGQENPLALIDAAKFYEVQKYCSLTGHMWEGFWMVANRAQFGAAARTTCAIRRVRLLNEGAREAARRHGEAQRHARRRS